MDPATLTLATTGLQLLPNIFHAVFGGGGPSAAQIAAMQAQQAAAARQRQLLVIGGIAVVGVVGLLLILRD